MLIAPGPWIKYQGESPTIRKGVPDFVFNWPLLKNKGKISVIRVPGVSSARLFGMFSTSTTTVMSSLTQLKFRIKASNTNACEILFTIIANKFKKKI